MGMPPLRKYYPVNIEYKAFDGNFQQKCEKTVGYSTMAES